MAVAPRAARSSKVMGVMARNFSVGGLDKKELGEEAAYFRRQEAEIAKSRQMKMDAILARDDSDQHKQALMDLVGVYCGSIC